MADPWPWPADDALTRAQRVCAEYRARLWEVAPQVAEEVDAMVARFGQTWATEASGPDGPDRTPVGRDVTELHVREDLVDYPEAARIAGVPEATVRQWKSRHHLDPADWAGRSPLFRPIDVLRAEAKAAATPQGRRRA